MYDDALAIGRSTGSKRETALALASVGTVLKEGGEVEAALRHYEEALDLNEKIGLRSSVADNHHQIAEILRIMGRLTDARRELDVALRLREQLKEELALAESHLGLAAISIFSSIFMRLCAWRALVALALKRSMNDCRCARSRCCFSYWLATSTRLCARCISKLE